MIKKDFTKKIEESKSKNTEEKLKFLSEFWGFDIQQTPFKLIGTYEKAEKLDKNGKEYGFFVNVRNMNGDILYYPFYLGQIRIWVEHKEYLTKQKIWLFEINLSNNKRDDRNPFQLSFRCACGNPPKQILDKIEKEQLISKLSDETETNIHINNNMNKTIIQQPQTVNNALDALLDNMYISNVHNRLRQLDHPQENDNKRWIWELIQNAKDSIVQDKNRQSVDIKVIVKDNIIIFKHNGSPFTAEAQMGLLYKYSGKKGNDSESTGRFGTGFLTTHTLSKIVSIEGDLYTDDSKSNLCGFSATMYRNGINTQELLDGVKKMRESMIYTKELNDWTTYSYILETDDNKKALEKGLENFIQNIAQVMLFCKELNTVELDNNGTITKIIRNQPKQLENEIYISEFEITGKNPHTRKFAHKKLSKHSEELTKRFKTDRNLRLMVATEIDNENHLVENGTAPSHFCVLPLVGSEKHIMPFYLNSPDFEPDSERESLLLDGSDNWEEHSELGTIITVRGINRLILKESIELYDSLVAYLSENNYYKLFLLAKGLRRSPDFEKNFNKDWFEKEIIFPYREVLKKYAIVETSSGNQKLFEEDNKTVNIIIPKDTNKEQQSRIYDLYAELSDKLPIKKFADEWAKYAWKDCGLFGVEDLCNYIAKKNRVENLPNTLNKYEWLNKFLSFIKETDESLLKKYVLIPNSNGDFVSLENGDFAEGVGLTIYMLDTLCSLGIDLKPLLLNSNITTINLPVKVDAKKIAEKINEQADKITNGRGLTNDLTIEKLLPLINTIPTDNSKFDKDFIRKQSQINEFMNCIYNFEIQQIENNDIPAKAWEATHKWLVAQFIKNVSDYKKIESLPESIDNKTEWLNSFIAFVIKEIPEGYLDKFAIIPNQKGDFCLKKDLWKDACIPKELKSEQAENFGIMLKNSLLHKEIKSVEITQEKDIRTVINIIDYIFTNNHVSRYSSNKDNLDFAIYLLHFLPEESSQILHKSQKSLLDIVRKYYYNQSSEYSETIIVCSTEDFWNKANDNVIQNLQRHIEQRITLEELKKFLSESGKEYDDGDTTIFLNDLYDYLKQSNITILKKIVPNQKGDFCSLEDKLFKDDNISDTLKDILYLVNPNNDFRKILADTALSIQPTYSKKIEDIAKIIDESIKDVFADSRNWDGENFKKAVDLLMKYFKTHEDSKDIFHYTFKNKERIELNVLFTEQDREILGKIKENGIENYKEFLAKDSEIQKLKQEKEDLLAENQKLKEEKETLELKIQELEDQLLNTTSDEEISKIKQQIAEIQSDLRNAENEIAINEGEIAINEDVITIRQEADSGISKELQKSENYEAKKLVRERLEPERFVFPDNYYKQYSTIYGVTKDGEEYPLVVKSYKYDKVPFKIGANEWIHLMNDNAMFWVHFGDGKLGCIKLYELLKKQSNLSLSFSTENLEAFRFSEDDMQDMIKGNHKGVDVLAKLLHYFKDVHFDFSNLNEERYTTTADSMDDYRFNDRQTENDITDNDSDSML